MKKWSKYLPEGMRDYIYEDVTRKRMIERAINETFEKRGYSEIITPVMEFFDVFNTNENHVPYEDMYKLIDGKGRILTLRHDMTTPIARVAATKLKGELLPIKLYYDQNVFRSNDDLHGKRDEVTQCGVELIGLANYRADVDVLVTGIEALKHATNTGFKIELGHVGFFKAIAKEMETDEETLEEIRSCIERKNFAQLDSILQTLDESNKGVQAMAKLPRLFGGVQVIDKAMEIVPNEDAADILRQLQRIINELTDLGYGPYIAVDLGMVHHIGYYTGIIFRGYLDGSGENCLDGGRYDTLSENFGSKLPSTGFAITVDSILGTQERNETKARVDLTPNCVVYYEEGAIRDAYKIYNNVNDMGKKCVISLYEDFDEALAHAKNIGAETFYHVRKEKTEIINL